jgi:hypothetical protein
MQPRSPSTPISQVDFLVWDIDRAIQEWQRILGEHTTDSSEIQVSRHDNLRDGEDVIAWASLVGPAGCEVRLCQPLNDGPLAAWLDQHGEGVHRIMFATPGLPEFALRVASVVG